MKGVRISVQLSIIEGIGEAYETKAEAAGVKSIEALLVLARLKKDEPNLLKNGDF